MIRDSFRLVCARACAAARRRAIAEVEVEVDVELTSSSDGANRDPPRAREPRRRRRETPRLNGNGPMTDDEVPAAIDAVRALRARGIDDAEQLLEFGTPAEILAACRKWDGRRGVRKGLLVKWIRERDFPTEEPAPKVNRGAINRAKFETYAGRYHEGAITESHAQLNARRWPDDLERNPCAGAMVVWDATYPNIAAACDACGFEAAYPLRGLHVLGAALELVPAPPTDQPF